ncbi:MAG: hypothetical protein FWD28_04660 [Treponema sp.]|nr:hypothetical protein [Treponema sp.]
MVYVFTGKTASLKAFLPKNTVFETSPLSKHSPSAADITYVDITGLTAADQKKAVAQLKKNCKDSAWGIIDPKGSIKDPAALFFEGASDYLGASFLKGSNTVDTKRLKEVQQWRKTYASAVALESASKAAAGSETGGFLKSGIKLPSASSFPGWKKMQTGKSMPFYLLYCSLQGKTSLDTRLGEKVLAQVHKRFLALLSAKFKAADGLLWMDTGKDCLILLPARAKSAELAIKACLGMIVAAPLHILEFLGINIPANFIFALHYGSVSYKPPGKTGTVVSDAVNSIFHLGAKKSEPGRLTISGELPDVSIPKALQDLFTSNGEYEGRKIWHTKKFNYSKAWF